MTSLNGASILVAGASGGLGGRVARLLAQRGAQLTLVARDPARLAALDLAGARSVPADLRDPHAPAAAVAEAVRAHGGLDGVVFAAGVVAFGPAAQTADDTLAALFETNVFAPVRLLRAAVEPLMRSAERGRAPFVLNVSAVVAEQPMAGLAAYGAAKAALTAFDAAAARELRRSRIRLVDARPPHTETGLADRPISGVAPLLATGLSPDQVAARLVRAIEDDVRDAPSAYFA